MSRATFKKHGILALSAAQADEPIPQAVFLPPALREGKNIVYAIDNKNLPSIAQNTVRINMEADPVGLCIAIALGMPVPTYSIDKAGDLKVKYETLPLNSPVRERFIKFLAERIMPRLSVKAKRTSGEEAKDNAETEWEALLGAAAEGNED